MSFLESVKSTWAAYKPRIIALAVGLALGPLLTNYFGYQVTTSTAQAQVRAGIVREVDRGQEAVRDGARQSGMSSAMPLGSMTAIWGESGFPPGLAL